MTSTSPPSAVLPTNLNDDTEPVNVAHAYLVGYLNGEMQQSGVITAEAWNEAIAAAVRFRRDHPGMP